MMEANPLPRVQTVATHSTRLSQQSAGQQSAGADNFEQQLSNQLEQTSSAQNTENSDNNQLLESSLGMDDTVMAAPADGADGADVLLSENSDLPPNLDAVEVEHDAAEQNPQLLLSTLDTDDAVQSVASLLDQTMPLAGNNLPPIDSQLPLTEQLVSSQNSSNTPVVATTSPQTVASTPVVQIVLDPAKANQAQVSVNSQVVDAELANEGASFQDLEIITANSGKQDSNLQTNQSRPGISIASSVAAAASQLQQVPLTTASANLNLPLSGFPVDSLLSVGVNPAGSSITSAVQSPAWSQGLTEQVAWMVRGNIQSAEIKLNPANLGPLEIKLSIEDDVARLSFVSSHAPVREALDVAMPRLREMLEQQGISLADVDVSQYSEQGQQSSDEATDGTGTLVNHTGDNTEPSGMADDVQGVSRVSMNDGLSIYA